MLTTTNQTEKELIHYFQRERSRITRQLKEVEKLLYLLTGEVFEDGQNLYLTKKGTRAKKRGPKSVWGKFILNELEKSNRPMTYKELMERAMAVKGLDESKFQNIRASILNSAFRLRAIQGKIATVGEEGKKDKFLVSVQWLEKTGELKANHKEWLRSVHDFHAMPVNMDEIPVPRYEEDVIK